MRSPIVAGPASVERLRGASAYATDGITLGGQSFGTRTATGVLALQQPEVVRPRSSAYPITLPAASAALVTISPGRAGHRLDRVRAAP